MYSRPPDTRIPPDATFTRLNVQPLSDVDHSPPSALPSLSFPVPVPDIGIEHLQQMKITIYLVEHSAGASFIATIPLYCAPLVARRSEQDLEAYPSNHLYLGRDRSGDVDMHGCGVQSLAIWARALRRLGGRLHDLCIVRHRS